MTAWSHILQVTSDYTRWTVL